jgi:hypothetical protein
LTVADPRETGREMHMAARFVLGLMAALSAGCGGNVVFVEDDAPPEPPSPPLTPLCQAAEDAVDWSACSDLSYEPWTTTSAYCENQSAVPACRAAAEGYYGCIAKTGGVCVPVVDPEVGSESGVVDIPVCQPSLDAFSACLSECGAPSFCPNDPTVCECMAPSALEGAACCWYPSCPADGSVPSCFEICGNCGTPR